MVFIHYVHPHPNAYAPMHTTTTFPPPHSPMLTHTPDTTLPSAHPPTPPSSHHPHTDNPHKMFHSFKKVLMEAGPTFSDVMLVSFNSSSKGFFGEYVGGVEGEYGGVLGVLGNGWCGAIAYHMLSEVYDMFSAYNPRNIHTIHTPIHTHTHTHSPYFSLSLSHTHLPHPTNPPRSP